MEKHQVQTAIQLGVESSGGQLKALDVSLTALKIGWKSTLSHIPSNETIDKLSRHFIWGKIKVFRARIKENIFSN